MISNPRCRDLRTPRASAMPNISPAIKWRSTAWRRSLPAVQQRLRSRPAFGRSSSVQSLPVGNSSQPRRSPYPERLPDALSGKPLKYFVVRSRIARAGGYLLPVRLKRIVVLQRSRFYLRRRSALVGDLGVDGVRIRGAFPVHTQSIRSAPAIVSSQLGV